MSILYLPEVELHLLAGVARVEWSLVGIGRRHFIISQSNVFYDKITPFEKTIRQHVYVYLPRWANATTIAVTML